MMRQAEQPLPLLWTADFILGAPKPPWIDGQDYYFIGRSLPPHFRRRLPFPLLPLPALQPSPLQSGACRWSAP